MRDKVDMEKEVGSIFPVSGFEYDPAITQNRFEGFTFFSLCREALLAIAKSCEKKVIMIPAYTCQTVIIPFIQEKWDIYFYSIDTNLCIGEKSFISLLSKTKPGIVLFHPYYGKAINDNERNLLFQAKESGAIVVQDLTQSIFSDVRKPYVDITVGSIRKWDNIPDGGFLTFGDDAHMKIIDTKESNSRFFAAQLDAMYLRGEYFRTDNPDYKQISIRINKYAEGLIDNEPVTCHKISDYSMSKILNADLEHIRTKRIDNFRTLFSLIRTNNKCHSVFNSIDELDSAPLYFPVFVENRKQFQKKLAENKIYAPILWGIGNSNIMIDDSVEYIYSHLLAIPIDQRYNNDDIQRIAYVINMICDSRE